MLSPSRCCRYLTWRRNLALVNIEMTTFWVRIHTRMSRLRVQGNKSISATSFDRTVKASGQFVSLLHLFCLSRLKQLKLFRPMLLRNALENHCHYQYFSGGALQMEKDGRRSHTVVCAVYSVRLLVSLAILRPSVAGKFFMRTKISLIVQLA